MFHSIYGTEKFQGFTLPLERRGEVRTLIGDRAEHLAYLNCAMDRASFDRVVGQVAEPYRIVDRITGEEVPLSRQDFDDLCRVHLFDWLEQVPRSREWDYRRPAYRKMAERLGRTAEEDYERIFARGGNRSRRGRPVNTAREPPGNRKPAQGQPRRYIDDPWARSRGPCRRSMTNVG